jgi:hypothetical protein
MDFVDLVLLLVQVVVETASWADSDGRSENPFSSAPDPNAEPDNWRCPDAVEFAKIFGDVHAHAETRSNSERGLPIARTNRDPLWDRQLDG